MHYFKTNPSPFQYKSGSEPPQKKFKKEKLQVSELDLCVSSYNLLEIAPEHFKEMWDWSCFLKIFSNHSDPEIRWIVCQSVAKLNSVSEFEKLKLVMQSVSEEENRKFSLKYFCNQKNFQEEIRQSVKDDVLIKSILLNFKIGLV
jgi:hypothetical protein